MRAQIIADATQGRGSRRVCQVVGEREVIQKRANDLGPIPVVDAKSRLHSLTGILVPGSMKVNAFLGWSNGFSLATLDAACFCVSVLASACPLPGNFHVGLSGASVKRNVRRCRNRP